VTPEDAQRCLEISARRVRELKASLAYMIALREGRAAYDQAKLREARMLVLEE
jgi:hypothetical protein